METSIRSGSDLRRRTILAAHFALTLVAAFALAFTFAAAIGVLTFAPSEKKPPPFSATSTRGCVPENPKGPAWVAIAGR
jgi:hypothetical protein